MVKRRGPPGQGWRSFFRNHPPDIAAVDLFVVPTIGCVGCTSNNGGISLGRGSALSDRDRDRIYGSVVTRRLCAMGIRDKARRTSFAPAEWLCRTADRIDPTRVAPPPREPARRQSAGRQRRPCREAIAAVLRRGSPFQDHSGVCPVPGIGTQAAAARPTGVPIRILQLSPAAHLYLSPDDAVSRISTSRSRAFGVLIVERESVCK
jgi:hypothetical protein